MQKHIDAFRPHISSRILLENPSIILLKDFPTNFPVNSSIFFLGIPSRVSRDVYPRISTGSSEAISPKIPSEFFLGFLRIFLTRFIQKCFLGFLKGFQWRFQLKFLQGFLLKFFWQNILISRDFLKILGVFSEKLARDVFLIFPMEFFRYFHKNFFTNHTGIASEIFPNVSPKILC